jgi:SAM-dependent methyltransferase
MKLCAACRAPLASDAWQCARCRWQAVTRDGVTVLLPERDEVVEGFSREQFENLLAVMPRHFWFAARNRLLAWAVRRHFPAARTLLEVGCGTGHVLQALGAAIPALRLTASEASFAGIREVARVLPHADLIQADVTRLPFDQEFDVVGAFDVLEHIPDDVAAMREIARSVSPGGGVVITVPQHQWLWSALDDYAGHKRRYSRASLVSLVRTAGLRPIFVTSFVSLLLPALLLSRSAQKGKTVDPMQEFRIAPAANRFAGWVMTAERALITAGLPLPAGGSLLLVARR